MRKTFFTAIILLLISCNSGNEIKIAELFEEVKINRVTDKLTAIKACEKIISIDKNNSDAYRILSDLKFETGNFEKSLELNRKLTELNPEIYHYHAKIGLLLELFDRKEESKIHYSKSRELLKQKEEYYWAKTDTLGMATMFIEVGDSIRGRALIDSIIARKLHSNIPEIFLREQQRITHGEILKVIKSAMENGYYSDNTKNNNKESTIEIIIDDRN